MTSNDARRRVRWLALGLLAVAALVGLAAAAQGQERVHGNVIANESSPIGFANAEDTVIEENDERSADRRVQLTGAALQGPSSFTGDGNVDLLLGLSATAASGIDEAVLDRYAHGSLEQASLSLTYQNGCNSPNGELSIHAIETPSWSPFSIGWTDTTRSEDGSVEVMGPELASVPVTPTGFQDNPNVGCNAATLDLATEPLERVLAGEYGGIAAFWDGEQELNVSTLNSGQPPQLDVNFTTGGPSVNDITIGDGAPVAIDTGERVTILVNATDTHELPSDAVAVEITPFEEHEPLTTVQASPSGPSFLATQTFPSDQEGLYNVSAIATDADGWTASGVPNATGPHLVVDGTAPEIEDPSLADEPADAAVSGDQDQLVRLSANVSDLSCRSGLSPCADWELTWRGETLAQGTLDAGQPIEADVELPRPGNTTARLSVEDAAGHTNTSTSWPLTILDTNPPDASSLAGSHLVPGQATTLENGTSLEVGFQIEDDLPVQARLLLEGTHALERELPDHDEQGRIEASFDAIPEGTYSARLVLDDGTHTTSVRVGDLTIAPRGAPSISFDLASERIGPQDEIAISVRDNNLDEERTSVLAEVNGLSVQPDVETTTVTAGQDLDVHLGELSHGDVVNLTARAHDEQGLEATATAQITVDARAPTLVQPGNRTWVAPGQALTFEAEDPGGGQTTLTIDAPSARTSASAPETVSVDSLVTEPGRLTEIVITLRDDLGNERTRSIQLGVDEEAPQASPVFTDEGLIVATEDAASGVLRVDAAVGVNGEELNETQVFQESPDRFFVATGALTRGDEVHLAAQVRDHVGHETELGTREDPLVLTVPDRPPTIDLERTSATVGDVGHVNWSITDPDEDPLDVTLAVSSPDGETTRESVDAIGSHAIEPEQPGRYAVTLEASSAQNGTQESTFFHLATDGRLTQATNVPGRIDPGDPLVFGLSFPSEPERVFVRAVDDTNASTSASVELDGSEATARFDQLPEGDYDIRATVVHEEGATEEVHVASVQSQAPIAERVGDLIVPLLVVLAIGLVVAIATLWYKRRQEEDEETEAAGTGPAP